MNRQHLGMRWLQPCGAAARAKPEAKQPQRRQEGRVMNCRLLMFSRHASDWAFRLPQINTPGAVWAGSLAAAMSPEGQQCMPRNSGKIAPARAGRSGAALLPRFLV